MTNAELDEQIYLAMLEMGWLFPTTVEQVEIFEKAMEREDWPELPAALREPPWERLRAAGY